MIRARIQCGWDFENGEQWRTHLDNVGPVHRNEVKSPTCHAA
jgi:hypothetical protein